MTEHEYLEKLLEAHKLADDSDEVQAMREQRDDVETLLRNTFKGANLSIRYGGSFAKKTMVSDSYDLDLLAYFANDDTTAGETLEEIYTSVKDALSDDYTVTPKRSALRLEVKDGDEYTHVDVVPGRFTTDDKEDVFLHQTEGDKERLKTNPDTHIKHVSDSGRRPIIKLGKIWKVLAELDLPTFILELLVIEILEDNVADGLDVLFYEVLNECATNLDGHTIKDPANGDNDLYLVFTDERQEELTDAAQAAIDAYEDGGFAGVFGESFDDDDQEETAERGLVATPYVKFPLGPCGHASPLPWPARRTPFFVSITCTARREGRSRRIRDNGTVASGSNLDYRATTNVSGDFDLHWRVVNTGDEATKAGDKRGTIHRGSVGRPMHRAETAKYLGKHWIECFIVQRGERVASSGRFYINVYHPSRRRVPFYRR